MEMKKVKDLKSNQAVLELVCALGLAPTIVDTKEWKKVVHSFDISTDTYSSIKFVDTSIPAEAIASLTKPLSTSNDSTISPYHLIGGLHRALNLSTLFMSLHHKIAKPT